MGLSAETVDVLKASVPVLKASGTDVTGRMYCNMVAKNPQLRSQFNMSHLLHVDNPEKTPKDSFQAVSLAAAILAYAENCDNLGALGTAVQEMAEKHVACNVTAEQYAIVGENLLESVKYHLGDKATDEVMAAWKEAYNLLADILIKKEASLYEEREKQEGGWFGYKTMKVVEKTAESDSITSFYLEPKDGGALVGFQPGQYITVKIPKGTSGCPTASGHDLVRNYSLSCRPGKGHLRISVKKEGAVSGYLHDCVQAGDEIELGVPCGAFFLSLGSTSRPLVLLSAGVGLTPLVSMLEAALEQDGRGGEEITFVQCCKSPAEHAMKEQLDQVAKENNIKNHVFYSSSDATDDQSLQSTVVHPGGRLTKEALVSVVPEPADGNEYFFCGPRPFMVAVRAMLEELEVPKKQAHFEFFGPIPEY